MFAGASLDENSGAFCELKANFFRLILTKAEILEMIMEIQMEIHLGIIMETGRITLVVHHLAELEVLAGMMDLVRLIII